MDKTTSGGYSSRLLRVNLTEGVVSAETLDDTFCRKYLGGAGFVTYFLWKEIQGGTDPLGPDNRLVFATGPVTGAVLPGSARHCVGAKSPLAGSLAKSEVGGSWGGELKKAGYDAVLLQGRAARPVYLSIDDTGARLRDASHLWGMKTKETQAAVRSELGDDRTQVASIGPGGENLVRYACIMHGLFDAAGRGGTGAVMGSKNLKAVAVRSHRKRPEVFDPAHLKELGQWLAANTARFPFLESLHAYGTGSTMEAYEAQGNLPVRNFRDHFFPGVKTISSPTVKETIGIGMHGCVACPIRCKKVVRGSGPLASDPDYGGPEYETLAGLGSNCGIDDLAVIAKANELCNAYSLDTISISGTLAWAMECFERGLLTRGDTEGLELRFGNGEALLAAIELIALRRGIGGLLAEGAFRASRQLGRGSEQFVIHVKGVESGYHEPRLKPGFGLGLMVNPHGADHCCNMQDPAFVNESQLEDIRFLGLSEPVPAGEIGPYKVAILKAMIEKSILFDSLGLCQMIPYSFEQVAELAAKVTGWNTSISELLRAAERILTTARLFNVREGFTAEDDRLPRRFFEPKADGSPVGALDSIQMEQAKRYYYLSMRWDPDTGVPIEERVEELGIA